jgi:hypothetical protein
MLLTCYKVNHKCGYIERQGRKVTLAVKIGWLLLALIHATPAFALFKPAILTRLYSIKTGSSLFTFMHHRAALFLVVVIMCIWAVFRPEVRQMATIGVGISMGTFVIIWALSGAPAALRTIAIADILGLAILLFVGWQAFAQTA